MLVVRRVNPGIYTANVLPFFGNTGVILWYIRSYELDK